MRSSLGAVIVKPSEKLRRSFRWLGLPMLVVGALCGLVPLVPMAVVSCPCDHARTDSLGSRVCSLCQTAETESEEIYFLRDINPLKPSRYLALPKPHGSGFQSTADLSEELRAKLWSRAAERAEELYPGRWGLAQNSHFFRTQCHAHIHIGPLSPEVDDIGGTLVATAEEVPNVGPEQGIWMHPRKAMFCVHLDRDLAEIVLVR